MSASPSAMGIGTACWTNVKVYRLIVSEQDRIGIGTFQPRDEKNQDFTELVGALNYRKIAEYGTDSDPWAFSPMNGCCDRSKRRLIIPDGRNDDFRREIMNYIVL
jgi:predicted Ser/Thr protein kinase